MMLREALPSDCDEVARLWHVAGLTRPWNDPRADFDLALASPNSTILLSDDDTAIVGTIMVGFDGHRGWVYYLAVDPRHQRHGIGRDLMTAAECWLADRGCQRVRLMVRGDNDATRGFYAAIGYDTQDVVTFGRTLG